MSRSETVAEFVDQLAAALGEVTSSDAGREAAIPGVQRLLELGVRAYLDMREAGLDFGPFPDGANVSATAAMVTAANMLQAVEVEVFELGLLTSFGHSGNVKGASDV